MWFTDSVARLLISCCYWLPCCIYFSLMDFLRASQPSSSVETAVANHIVFSFVKEILIILEIQKSFSSFIFQRGMTIMPWLASRAGVRSWSLEKQYGFLSSLRALCLSLAVAVCHATERRGRALPSLSCIPPSCHSLTHSPLQAENLSPSSAQLVLKGLCSPSREISSSANRCTEPVPSVIHLSIRLPV